MERCTICGKEWEITRECELNSGYVGRVCPNCALRKWNRMLFIIAAVGAVVAAALIVGESRGLSDTLILIGIYIVLLVGLFGFNRWAVNDVKRAWLFERGRIEKRGWPITSDITYILMASNELSRYEQKHGAGDLFKKADAGERRENAKNGAGNVQQPQQAARASTGSRLASNMPVSSLQRIFAFTSGDGQTLFSCPVAAGTLQDTLGCPLDSVIGKMPLDIIAGSDVGAQTERTGQFPEAAWTAMGRIAPGDTAAALAGSYRTCIRPYHNPVTGVNGCFVLLYRK